MSSKYMPLKIFIVFIFAVFVASFYYRFHQYQVWEEYPQVYMIGTDHPAMTTLDAYYWLRYAKEYKNGSYYINDNDTLRAFPEGTKKPEPVPLISFIIAWISKIFNTGIYYSGLYIIPLFASLFVFPLGFYLYRKEMPIAGIAASVVGSFAWMYAIRTAMGRVDTDLLQLFFLFAGSLGVFAVSKTESEKRRYIYSFLLGLNFLLFGWWYAHFGIDVVYLLVLIVMLIIRKVPAKQIATSVLLFIIFANPLWVFSGFSGVFEFFNSYNKIKTVSGNFPNVKLTITEAEHLNIAKTLKYMLSNPLFDTLGIVFAIAALLFMRWDAIPLLPIFLLGLLSFRSSNRMVMFLAPFVGLGWGFLLDMVMRFIAQRNKNELFLKISAAIIAFAVSFSLLQFGAYRFVPAPSIAAPIIKSFEEIHNRFKKGVIFTWWDYGYAIEDIAGFATYQDGGAHGGARTYLVAHALSVDNQTLLYHTVSFMDRFGVKPVMKAIHDNISTRKAVERVFDYSKPIGSRDNYLLFSYDMIGKFYSISFLGRWDFKRKKSHPLSYEIFNCSGFKNGMFFCRQGNIDINRGLVIIGERAIPIKTLYFIEDGYVARTKSFEYPRGAYLELCFKKGKKLTFLFGLLTNKEVVDSNFNRLFIMGDYNDKYFEEVYNNFPFVRMYRVK
ncbi:STT3 domain-containing protein [Hippea jasoniae]|uniref:STT3 domain-containing protein n=1 Tax=Hippea jasoniae TaxID=944479 RepID=UPI00054F35A1|nr:STT3 domain-containing protein [Hippea jasoniae]